MILGVLLQSGSGSGSGSGSLSLTQEYFPKIHVVFLVFLLPLLSNRSHEPECRAVDGEEDDKEEREAVLAQAILSSAPECDPASRWIQLQLGLRLGLRGYQQACDSSLR